MNGIFPAVATPFSADGAIDFEALDYNLAAYFDSRLAGVLLLGSTGEAIHLNRDERLEIVRRGAAMLPSGKHLLVGLGGGALGEAVDFARRLGSFQVTALLAGVPSYFKGRMTAQALIRYYRELAEAAPFPLLLYNVPQFTGLEIPVPVVSDLSRHPRIVGMKESSGDLIYVQEILSRVDSGFQLLTGSSQNLGPALTLGIRGAILAVACAVPEMPIALLEAYARGDDISGLQGRLFRLSQLLTVQYGIAGLKYAMDLLGWRGGLCRLPLLPLSRKEEETVEEVLRGLGLETRPAGRPT